MLLSWSETRRRDERNVQMWVFFFFFFFHSFSLQLGERERSAESFEIFNDRASCQSGGRFVYSRHGNSSLSLESVSHGAGLVIRDTPFEQPRSSLARYIIFGDLLSPLCQRSKWPRKSRRVTRSPGLYFSRAGKNIDPRAGDIKTTGNTTEGGNKREREREKIEEEGKQRSKGKKCGAGK